MKYLTIILIFAGSGCATIQKIARIPGLVVTFAEIFDQSTGCFMGLTEKLNGPYLYRNTCDMPVTVVAVNRSYK
ncbi:hypothetical protein WDW37_08120 [Bdellovibrionota bacterium FG-1]